MRAFLVCAGADDILGGAIRHGSGSGAPTPSIPPSGIARVAAIGCCLLLVVGCDDFPRDPGETLENVRGATLRAGIIEAEPWVVVPEAEGAPAGVEVAMLRVFAARLEAEPRFTVGGQDEILAALQGGRLDVAAGGLTSDSPWRRRVAFTRPYHREELVVAAPPGTEVDGIEGRPVLVPAGSELAVLVREADGIPVTPQEAAALPDAGAPVLLAKARWQVGREERVVAVIGERRRVFAIRQGENAFLVTLDRFLDNAPVSEMLEEVAREGSVAVAR